jgi:aminoglycoside N3'-acetyltransferase
VPRTKSIWERFSVPQQQLLAELGQLLSTLPATTPVVVHSDILRTGIPDGLSDSEQQCNAWIEILVSAASGRPLLLPTFNYDFARTRLFDPTRDLGQVGRLSRYCTERYAALRTRTPIFNFCILNNDGISLAPESNPFGPGSTFAMLDRRNAAVVFLGADMIANTFIHYVEEQLQVGYRYLKPFPGRIADGADLTSIDFCFRVRPLVTDAVVYGDLGEHELQEKGMLRAATVGHSAAMMYRTNDYMNIVGAAMRKDELHVLTPESRAMTEELYRRYGRPLTFEKLERVSPA